MPRTRRDMNINTRPAEFSEAHLGGFSYQKIDHFSPGFVMRSPESLSREWKLKTSLTELEIRTGLKGRPRIIGRLWNAIMRGQRITNGTKYANKAQEKRKE